MSRSSSCWQWHGFCRFAGYDDFALCSLRRRQARGVFTGAFAATVPAACFASWMWSRLFWGHVHRHRAGGHVHRDMTPIIRCIRAVVSTKTLLLHLVRTTTTTTTLRLSLPAPPVRATFQPKHGFWDSSKCSFLKI